MDDKSTAAFNLGDVLGVSASVLEAIPGPLFIKDTGSVYLWANRAWAELMGLDPGQVAGNPDSALFSPEFALAHSEPDRRALSTGAAAQKVILLDAPGPPDKTLQVTVAPIVGPDGQAAGVVGMAREVTDRTGTSRTWDERVRYQEAVTLCTRSLLMSKTSDSAMTGFLRHLGEINNVHSASVFQNFQGDEGALAMRRRYSWTRPGCHRTHPVPAQIPYAPWLVRWHLMLSAGLPVQGTIETFPPEEGAVLADEGIRSVLLLPLAVGGEFWGCVRLAEFDAPREWDDGELRTLSIAAESLSAFVVRMQSEEALRRKIEEQEALWAGTPGKTDFDFFSPEEVGKFRDEDRAVIESGEALSNIEDTLASRSGGTIQVISTKAPLRDSNGAVVGIIGITRDITERSELERQVRQAQKMESVGTLTAGIAHDFNNLLTAILGFSHVVLPKLEAGSTIYGYVERIAGAGKRAKHLVRQLLTFSRQVEAEKQPVSLTPILKETLKFLRSSLPANIEIVSSLPDEAPCVEADPTQMHQVIMNLCVNAAHAMAEGGTLTVRLEPVEPDESSSPESGEEGEREWVQLTVKDTGCGMDEATLARMYEPFFTTKEAGKGTGLGLSTVYGIVKDSNGAIEVDSAPGEGTVFRVRLPVTHAAARPEDESQTEQARTGHETVLFVDDEPDVVELGRATLEDAGYTVLTASDGEEALALYESRPDEIAVVMTDKTMPRMGGPQLAGRVLGLRPDAKIVLCSGQTMPEEDRRPVEEAGGTTLLKPFIPTEILAAVRKVLET